MMLVYGGSIGGVIAQSQKARHIWHRDLLFERCSQLLQRRHRCQHGAGRRRLLTITSIIEVVECVVIMSFEALKL